MTGFKILVTGATGYIGGTILSDLVNSQNNSLRKSSISGLVRGEAKAKVLSEKGVNVELFSDLDASDEIEKIAGGYDMVIHTASGYHEGSAKALILGLAERKKSTGKDVYYIHTSGTSNLGDQPITGKYTETRVFSDKEDIYSYEKMRNEKQPYGQRQTDLTVIGTGLKVGVKTYIIMSPLIYGIGTGHFHQQSIQVPAMIQAALKTQQAEVVGSGKASWDHVHVGDLANLYEIVVQKLLAGEDLPNGEKGIYFSANGHHTWLELSQGLADALFTLGISKTEEVKSINLEEAAERWAGGDTLLAELGFASNSRTESELSRSLGWKPRKSDRDFKNHFQTEVENMMEEREKNK
ncbi:hypothetical protein HO133_004120 [Letharia lupina]|uniref:NAD-dependent epimerase/dehydratase domain-containing protein n=1 Tax=Letharia lupina TaxID=560253 RepID=A0A8H6F973_9LECA|nr:uncharacterized protein HO133_004120 [Letharia lupina]KAF6219651.1 hypothetical protein HO133_004120 [Letharia lupina]